MTFLISMGVTLVIQLLTTRSAYVLEIQTIVSKVHVGMAKFLHPCVVKVLQQVIELVLKLMEQRMEQWFRFFVRVMIVEVNPAM